MFATQALPWKFRNTLERLKTGAAAVREGLAITCDYRQKARSGVPTAGKRLSQRAERKLLGLAFLRPQKGELL
jgi:hypothetical protein